MDFIELLKVIAPLLVAELILKIYCLVKLREDEVKYMPKYLWAIVIICVSTLGPVSYLVFGRVKD